VAQAAKIEILEKRRCSVKKTISGFSLAVGTAVSLGAFVFAGSAAKAQDYAELARRMVKTSASVKPGDVVVVFGGKHDVALMEDLAIESAKAGGLVTMFLDSDKYERAIYTEVPEQYLEQQPTFFAEWLKHINVFISLPGVEDSKATYGDVPQERFAKANKAAQVVTDALNASGVRAVFVGYPSPSDAAVNQLDFATYQKVFWDAVGADYQKISEQGNKLKQMLQGAKTVRVTSPSGTDFTFSVGDRPIFVDDGIMTEEKAKSQLALTRFVSLPSGSVFFAPIETSANGKVVVPKDRCQFKPLTGESFEFKQGHLENFKAEQGAQCFAEFMAPYSGPKDVFSSFQIGLNPAAQVMENPGDYRPSYAAGLVSIGTGDNQLMGGSNKVKGGGGWSGVPIVNATVTIDGKTVVQDGKLTL
jgi:leucyl aminopeptidase (aminopeptidase T)